MGNFKNDIFYFSIISCFIMGGLLSFTDLGINKDSEDTGKRDVAQVGGYALEGQNCASKLKEIKITAGWKQDPIAMANIQEAFKSCLSEYIQIKTISPDGNEDKAVEFFKSIFSELAIPFKTFEVEDLRDGYSNPRLNLVATLSNNKNFNWNAKQEKKSIILLNHMDVVDVHPEQWKRPELAFSGAIEGSEAEPEREFIWGRGALDMKGIGIVQLFNIWLLKESKVELTRDIHFLAVADEENNGAGAIGAIRKMQEGHELYALASANLVLNEGGGGIQDIPAKGWDIFLVAVEEKGGAWMEFANTDPVKLLQNMYKAKILDMDSRISKKDKKIAGHGCVVTHIETPKAKVNVIASKIILDLKCRKGFQAKELFTSVFKHSFKTVNVDVIQHKENYRIILTTSSSSHGSVGLNESAPTALAMGLYHLDILKIKKTKKKPSYFKYIKTDATIELLKQLGRSDFKIKLAKALSFIPFVKNFLLSEVEKSFGVDGLFRTTCQLSAMSFDSTGAKSLVDCRLVHSINKHKYSKDHAGEFIKTLKRQINDDLLNIKLLSGWNVSQSTIASDDYKIIEKSLLGKPQKGKRKSMVVPYLFPAGSDSTWFRNPFSAGVENMGPIPCYGFFPIFLNAEMLGTMHGANERFPVDEINPTIDRYYQVLENLLAK